MTLRKLICTTALAAALCANAAKAPRYVFYFIGDGMGINAVQVAQDYMRIVHDSTLTVTTFPVAAYCQTYSANSPITDSAAAGSALACGHKTNNHMLGMTPDTVAMNSVAYDLHQRGYGVALVTSVHADDATPGAFYAHVPERYTPQLICQQAAECGYEFLAGAGLRGLSDHNLSDSAAVAGYFAANNVPIVRDLSKLADINSRRVVMLSPYGPEYSNIGYTIDSIPGAYSLPQLAQAGLDHMLKVSPDRFFMMIEGGNIDHAAHGNDGGAYIKEIINFDQAIRMAYDFYLKHPKETLILMAADHETGGMSIGRNSGYKFNPGLVDYQKISKEAFSRYCKQLIADQTPLSWEEMQQYLKDNFGFWGPVKITSSQEKKLKGMFDKTFILHEGEDQKTLYANFNAFAVEVFDIFNDAARIGWTTRSHSGGVCPVFAIGVDAELFGAPNNNIDLPQKLRRICKIDK